MVIMYTNNIRIFRLSLLGVLMWLMFASCENTRPEMDITFESDARVVRDALIDMNQSLSENMSQLEAAMAGGLIDYQTALDQARLAVESMEGSLEEKMAAVMAVVQTQGTSMEVKLALIEATTAAGLADSQTAQSLLLEMLTSLSGTLETKLAAIESALASQQASLSSKLSLIETAVKEGFAGDKTQQELIQKALEALGETAEDKFAALAEAMESRMLGLKTKLELLEESLTKEFTDDKTAIELISTALSSLKGLVEGVDEQIDTVVTKLGTLDPATGTVSAALTSLLMRMDEIPNHSALIAAIEQTLEELKPKAPTMVLTSPCIEGDKIWIMSMGYIDIPYSFTSEGDFKTEITCPRDSGFTYSLYPNETDPRRGEIRLTAGNIVDGTMTVQFKVSDGTRSSTQTFYYKQLVLELAPNSNATRPLGYEGGSEELRYRTNVECEVAIPDSVKSWIKIVSSGDMGEDKYIDIEVAPNYGKTRKGHVFITEQKTTNAHTLHFYIEQTGTAIIRFRDPNLEAMLVANEKVNLNRDTCITLAEVLKVQSLVDMFGDKLKMGEDFTSFNEFEYFTGITDIPAGSFHNWQNLTSIYLPSTIKTIGGGYGDIDGPFTDCPKLDTLRGKFTVDKKALVYNGKLLKVVEPRTSFTIPDNVSVIGSKAFYKSKIYQITIPSSVKTIRDHAFEYSDIQSVTFAMSGADPTSASAYVDSLAQNAFVHCFKLEEFNGPTQTGTNGLRVTSDKRGLCFGTTLCAFAMGTNTTTFDIPENLGVTKLADYLFDASNGNGAVQLTEVWLPSTLTHIGTSAFGSQGMLPPGEKLKLHFRGENPPEVRSGAFLNVNQQTITIIVPAVLNGDNSVNAAATTEREKQFESAMGLGEDFFNLEYFIPTQQ